MAGSPAPGAGYDQSAVPAHIRRAAETSEKALTLMREGKDPRDMKNWEGGQNEPQRAQEPPPPQQAQPEPPKPQTPPATAQEPPKGTEPPKGNEPNWEQRYHTLHGQFETQQRHIRGLEHDLDESRNALRILEQQQTKLPAGQNPPTDINSIMTDAERDEWGPDLVAMIDKVANARVAGLQERLTKLEGTTTSIEKKDARSRQEKMEDDIRAANIDFHGLNNEQDFLDWMQNVDVGSGKVRRDLIQDAWNRGEGHRVVYFARQFLREVRGAEPEAQPPKETGKGRAAAPQAKGLEDIAAPGKGKVAQTPQTAGDPNAPKTYTAKEYAEFFRDKALGRLRMTPEAIAERVQELDNAYREGRIIETPQQ